MDKNTEKILYEVLFKDGTTFKGGSFEYPAWSKCPNKLICELDLFLPNGEDKIRLKNYEKYNFFIGASKPINQNKIILGHMYGLGSKNGIVTSYRITLISSRGNKYKAGDITVRKFPFGKEGIGRTATTGWKNG